MDPYDTEAFLVVGSIARATAREHNWCYRVVKRICGRREIIPAYHSAPSKGIACSDADVNGPRQRRHTWYKYAVYPEYSPPVPPVPKHAKYTQKIKSVKRSFGQRDHPSLALRQKALLAAMPRLMAHDNNGILLHLVLNAVYPEYTPPPTPNTPNTQKKILFFL